MTKHFTTDNEHAACGATGVWISVTHYTGFVECSRCTKSKAFKAALDARDAQDAAAAAREVTR